MIAMVTGGGGALGSFLVRSLLHNKMKVRVLDKKKGLLNGLENENLDIVLGGIEEHDVVNKAMKNVDLVYHFAFTFSDDPATLQEINIRGTTSLLESAKRENVQQFLHASSVAVIGRPTHLPIDESHPCDPETFRGWPLYAVTKCRIEEIVLSYCRTDRLPTTAFRLLWPIMNLAFLDTGIVSKS